MDDPQEEGVREAHEATLDDAPPAPETQHGSEHQPGEDVVSTCGSTNSDVTSSDVTSHNSALTDDVTNDVDKDSVDGHPQKDDVDSTSANSGDSAENSITSSIPSSGLLLVEEDVTVDKITGKFHVGNTPLHAAAKALNKHTVDSLLKSGTDVDRVNNKKRSAFHEMALTFMSFDISSQFDNLQIFTDIVKLLIKHGLDVNMQDNKGQTPLHYAVSGEYGGPYEMLVELFLEVGLDCGVINKFALQNALHIAVSSSSLDVVKLLVQHNKTTQIVSTQDKGGQTPLHIASKGKNKMMMLQFLIRHGAAPNKKDEGGRTPLHVSAKTGRVQHIELLLDHGARVHEKDKSGQTALHIAASNDITGRALACLVRQSSNEVIDMQDDIYQETALHKAVKLQMLENIKVLVRLNKRLQPNPNLRDTLGDTPLHKAVSCTEVFVWKYLLSLRADPDITNQMGLSVFHQATKMKNITALNLIKQHYKHRYE